MYYSSTDLWIRYISNTESGADPGFRRGGGSYIQKGGGVRTGISGADPNCCRAWANQQATNQKIADSRRGGGGCDHPKETPVSAPESHRLVGR